MKLIKATKAIDTSLFGYGLFMSLFLIANAINSLSFYSDLAILALFLPVPAYFLLEIGRFVYHRFHHFANPGYFDTPQTTTYYFSLPAFLDQDNRLFLINLFLLTIALCLTLLRLSLIIWARS